MEPQCQPPSFSQKHNTNLQFDITLFSHRFYFKKKTYYDFILSACCGVRIRTLGSERSGKIGAGKPSGKKGCSSGAWYLRTCATKQSLHHI